MFVNTDLERSIRPLFVDVFRNSRATMCDLHLDPLNDVAHPNL